MRAVKTKALPRSFTGMLRGGVVQPVRQASAAITARTNCLCSGTVPGFSVTTTTTTTTRRRGEPLPKQEEG